MADRNNDTVKDIQAPPLQRPAEERIKTANENSNPKANGNLDREGQASSNEVGSEITDGEDA